VLGAEITAFTVGYVLVMSVLGTVLVQNADGIVDRAGLGWDRSAAD
jgi:hypothetical protein